MNRTRSSLGALLLSALAVCAFGVANAPALTLHECKIGIGTGKHYTDATCSRENAEGAFATEPVAGEPELEGTLTPTTAGAELTIGETGGTHAVLHTTIAAIEVQITCSGFTTPSAKAKNGEAGEVMSVTGSGKWKFTGCSIVGSAKPKENCQVPETLEFNEMSLTTEEDKIVFKPKEGTLFITIPFSSKPGKTCPAAILGEKALAGGAIKGAVASPTALEFTNTSGTSITLGGAEAKFTAVIHYKTKSAAEGSGTVAFETP